ncbi:hypothetical protein QYF36_025582 [Acer negundo]|nr:hypothetical protein QYF36_025582 [Acer negundo]
MASLTSDQRNTNYIPVQFTVSIVEEYPEKVGVKAEEQSQSSSSCTRKKVTFDSNFNGSYPPNHRNQNCRECDDEEDEIDYENSDLDDKDDDGVLDYDDMYEEGVIVESKIAVAKEEIEEAAKPIRVNGSARDRSTYIHSVRNPVENLDQWKALKTKGKQQLKQQNCKECDDEEDEIDFEDSDLDDEDDDGVLDYDDIIAVANEEIEEAVKPIRVNGSARDRSAYIHSVRNPVENLDQWKALKMKGKPQLEQQKENEEPRASFSLEEQSFKELSDYQSSKSNQEIAVDASLSNWLLYNTIEVGPLAT